jgi:hypothetical protein
MLRDIAMHAFYVSFEFQNFYFNDKTNFVKLSPI